MLLDHHLSRKKSAVIIIYGGGRGIAHCHILGPAVPVVVGQVGGHGEPDVHVNLLYAFESSQRVGRVCIFGHNIGLSPSLGCNLLLSKLPCENFLLGE